MAALTASGSRQPRTADEETYQLFCKSLGPDGSLFTEDEIKAAYQSESEKPGGLEVLKANLKDIWSPRVSFFAQVTDWGMQFKGDFYGFFFPTLPQVNVMGWVLYNDASALQHVGREDARISLTALESKVYIEIFPNDGGPAIAAILLDRFVTSIHQPTRGFVYLSKVE
ncbi:hypothetical protein Asppvi_005841 [Aspergillus pseudoviridinutans]|uniref:Uncharacterized protein n=1 Tax=Aspergillus pseudoviridinutans TaxID=1517512 RepID=A0A9P3B8X9_9EURO|nr:uncharacterized protein Asppvi_005841 [Aspergillus pseudoviridinutans]GIJ86942.1 hypothetical protein Asppvi_005841 [Aspergillus pseudoviridinutans]